MEIMHKKAGWCRLMTLMIAFTAIIQNVSAIVRNDEVEVDGIRYATDYYGVNYIKDCSDVTKWETLFTLESDVNGLMNYTTVTLCQGAYGPETLHFYDGSELPGFAYPVRVIKSNSANRSLPRENPDEEEKASRNRFYSEVVWIQDSVLLNDLPNFRKKKYQVVCDIDEDVFYGGGQRARVRFLRTPKYMVIRPYMFRRLCMRTVRIGAAQLVDSYAFNDCEYLETVFFESSPYVRDDAFKGCPNIKYVIMDGKLPKPAIKDNDYFRGYDCDLRFPFEKVVYEQAILYVHEDQLEAFRKDKTWGQFKNIRDIEEYYAGVENVASDTTEEVEYDIYDLTGVPVRKARFGENWREGLPSGIYIVRSSLGTVRKELIK